ncbi:MAG: DUF4160 domain-containing protein [Flavobacteriales bacterium]|jgi:hypothetical protein|nr:DUF4160 domain-containing protein [Flavobacteriales bacterium]
MAPKAIKPNIEGYAFYFFSNENNEPAHVHVRKGDGWSSTGWNPPWYWPMITAA